jgi:hypothetical protein
MLRSKLLSRLKEITTKEAEGGFREQLQNFLLVNILWLKKYINYKALAKPGSLIYFSFFICTGKLK